MRRLVSAALTAAVTVALCATAAAASPNSKRPAPQASKPLTVTVLWDNAMTGKEAGIWMGYLFARMKYVSNHGGQYARVAGVVAPRYEEEVHARTEAVHIYRDIRARKPEMAAPYFDALDKVEAAGFMREYVWQFLRRPEWAAPNSPLRSVEFEHWARDALRDHRVETRGRIALTHSEG